MSAALTPDRAKAARRLLGWSLIRMSSYCDVSDVTIERFEKGQRVDAQTVSTIRQALELGGVEFTAEQPPGGLRPIRGEGSRHHGWIFSAAFALRCNRSMGRR